MPAPFAGWSPAGIVALIAIVAGIVLLVAYARAARPGPPRARGDRDGRRAGNRRSRPPSPPRHAARARSAWPVRSLLVVGLALGAVAALGSWATGDATTGGPGLAPADCAQSWDGCPKATPNP